MAGKGYNRFAIREGLSCCRNIELENSRKALSIQQDLPPELPNYPVVGEGRRPMDQELRVYLDDMKQDLISQIVEASHHAEQLNESTRVWALELNQATRIHAEELNQATRIHAEELNQAMRVHVEELNQAMGVRVEELNQATRARAEELNQATRAHAEVLNQATREHAERTNHETRILFEGLRADVRLVAEGVTAVREELGRILADHEERLNRLERYSQH